MDQLLHGAEPTLGDQLIRTLRLLQNAACRAPRLHEDVDPMSVPLLFKVARDPGRISALAQAFHADLSTISRQVSHLVDLGLMRKEPDPEDRRASILAVTDEGLALCAAMRTRRDRWIDYLLADWTEAERATLNVLLGRFADVVEHSDVEVLKELS